MSEKSLFPKIDLIERDAEIELMRTMSREVASGAQRVLYFEARGGLGKTRLLQDYPEIVAEDCPPMLVADIIDMYDFENRKPIEIERKIANSLKIAANMQGISKQMPGEIFIDYEKAYGYYHAIRGVSDIATRTAEKKIHDEFINSCNRLSQINPIVLRFDTFEIMLNARPPKFSFVFDRPRKTEETAAIDLITYSENAGVNIVLQWFNLVIPKLKPSLTIIAARPTQNIITDKIINIDIEKQNLSILKTRKSISEYLQKNDLQISEDDDRIPYIQKITGGFPLLLTLYAKTLARTSERVSRNTYEFEDDLIEQVFNLQGQLLPTQDSPEPPDPQHTFTFCLYILSCARRGIRRKELRGVFDTLGIKADDRVIDNLEDETLIKTVRNWQQPSEADETVENPDNTLLLLHDEIQVLIDRSRKLDELSYSQRILDYLCAISEEQVRMREPGVTPLKLMSDHMYYELTRDVTRGYRTYTVYADWFLRQRYIQDALILADVFWSTLLHEVERGGQIEMPFYDRLVESLQVSITDIRQDEGVRYVKRLRLSDEDAEAAAWAEELYQEFAKDKVVPTEPDARKLSELDNPNYYIFVDLCLNWATAIRHKDSQKSEDLLSTLIWLLESEGLANAPQYSDNLKVDQHLAYLRRKFFLGSAFNMLGQLYDGKQLFTKSVLNLGRARDEMISYQLENILLYRDGPQVKAKDYLNDDITGSLAHIDNNLAFNTMQNGKLSEALELSNAVIRDYITNNSIASSYQQALFYNTNATIAIRLGAYDQAKAALDRARIAADKSAVDRAIGLVMRTFAIYQRASWNNGSFLDLIDLTDIDRIYFELSAIKLRGETVAWGELHHERARFARDLVLFFQQQGDSDHARDYWNLAMLYLDRAGEALEKNDDRGMKRANLFETRASLHLIKGDVAEAQQLLGQAEDLMKIGESMPRYGHVVAGKIELQRALIALRQGHLQDALLHMTIALARAYLFAPDMPAYREQAAFERLIAGWIHERQVPIEEIDRSIRAFDGENAMASNLPSPSPSGDEWLIAWERSRKFFQALPRLVEEKANANAA